MSFSLYYYKHLGASFEVKCKTRFYFYKN